MPSLLKHSLSQALDASCALVNDPMRLEHEVLLHCVRPNPEPDTSELLNLTIGKGMDWDYLLRVAAQHGVLPLLCWNLNRLCSELIPSEIQEQLDDHFQLNALRNLFLSGEMFRLVSLFGKHAIKAIPFKGPVLAASIYGDLSLREFIDLDILVRPQDRETARDLLMSEGYVLDPAISETKQAARLRSGCALTMARRDNKSIVDLHWEFTASRFSLPFDFEILWDHLETVSVAGQKMATLSPVYHLLVVSAHGAKHRWARLEWICDVAGLVSSQPELDWKRCLEESTNLRSERILLHALLVARDLLGVNLPSIIRLRSLADPVAQSLAHRAIDNLFAESNDSLLMADESAFHLQMREQLFDRIPYIFHLIRHWSLPTARDRELFPLPSPLSFLYVFFRPIRLLFEYGFNPLAHFLKSFRLTKS